MASRAVCLVSGGMDSAVALAEARAAGFECYALSFDYGQRHRSELDAARRVAAGAREHRVVALDLRAIGGSALTADVAVPKDRPHAVIGQGVPATYVPARNTIFLSVALGWAEILGARDLYLGVNALDYSGYPDCRPEFLRAFEDLARVATAAGAEEGARFRVHAPLMELDKAGIVRRGLELGVLFAPTFTCYDPFEAPGAAGKRNVLALRQLRRMSVVLERVRRGPGCSIPSTTQGTNRRGRHRDVGVFAGDQADIATHQFPSPRRAPDVFHHPSTRGSGLKDPSAALT